MKRARRARRADAGTVRRTHSHIGGGGRLLRRTYMRLGAQRAICLCVHSRSVRCVHELAVRSQLAAGAAYDRALARSTRPTDRPTDRKWPITPRPLAARLHSQRALFDTELIVSQQVAPSSVHLCDRAHCYRRIAVGDSAGDSNRSDRSSRAANGSCAQTEMYERDRDGNRNRNSCASSNECNREPLN